MPRFSPPSAPRIALAALLAAGSPLACGSSPSDTGAAAVPACDEPCQDNLVARSLRESIRVGFNLLLQGGKVGDQDKSGPCPMGGKVHVTGTATSDASTGTTKVDLTWEFSACGVQRVGGRDDSYDVVLDGTVTEKGTISNVSGQTTALVFSSDSLKVTGTVSDPAVKVDESCAVALSQDGGTVSGKVCGRKAGFSF